MEIRLYNTKSPNNFINKVLTDENILTAKLKGNVNIQNPVLMLKSEKPLLNNYCYIPDFQRYYFINNIETFPNGIYYINCTVDVLESFKNDILNSKGNIRKQTKYNKYYNTEYENEERKEVDIYKSDVTLPDSKNNILVTIGG